MSLDIFSIFSANCVIACGKRAYNAARIFSNVAQGKWRPKFPKSFMLLAHNSTRLCPSVCLSVYVSESSLSEVRQCRIKLCPTLYH